VGRRGLLSMEGVSGRGFHNDTDNFFDREETRACHGRKWTMTGFMIREIGPVPQRKPLLSGA
jgi:hypothetical protein